jgi:hypothetical protein
MPIATEVVKWSALGQEAVVALFGGIGLVGAFGLILVGRDRRPSSENPDGSAVASYSLVALGSVICIAALVIGFVAMTHKSS